MSHAYTPIASKEVNCDRMQFAHNKFVTLGRFYNFIYACLTLRVVFLCLFSGCGSSGRS